MELAGKVCAWCRTGPQAAEQAVLHALSVRKLFRESSYGHFSLDELRGAVENISAMGIESESPVKSPVRATQPEDARPN